MNSYFNKTMYLFYKLLQIFFGFDFGFFDYKSLRIKLIGKFFCFFQCSITCLLLLLNTDVEPSSEISEEQTAYYWYIFYLFQYMIYVLIFLFCRSDSTLFQFQCATKLIDMKLKCVKAYNSVEKRKTLTFGLFVAYRSCLFWYFRLVRHHYDLRPVWVSVYYFLVLSWMDLVVVTYTFIFYSIYYRLTILINNLRTTNDNFLHYHKIYKFIVDIAEKFKSAYDPVFVAALLWNVPQMIISIFWMVWNTQTTHGSSLWMIPFRAENFAVAINMTIILCPAVLAGKLCKQADELRLILHDKLLFERDELKCYEIVKFIRYIEARPLKFTVYKVIPLDAGLVGMVINFAVTYLIVMIQFTHLF